MPSRGGSGCQCGACAVSGTCDDCLECYPHFLCAALTAKAGSEVCCRTINALMYHQCKGSWGGSAICAGENHVFLAYVEEDEYGNCYFIVNYNGDIVFSEIFTDRQLPAVSVDLGYNYTLTVGAGNGFTNPPAFDACGSCKCARCAPQSFCVQLSVTPLTQYGICDECSTSGSMTCVGGGYHGTLVCGENTFTLSLSPIAGTCSMQLRISSGDDSYESTYSFEVLLEPQAGANGHLCKHAEDFAVIRGAIGGGNQDVYGVSTEPFEAQMEIDNGNARALFTITPKWCGGCPDAVNPDCPGGCASISATCDAYCGSTVLHGEVIAPGCGIDGSAFSLRSCNVIYGVDRNTNWPAESEPYCQQHVVYEDDPYLGIKTNRTYYTCGTTVANATFFTAELYYLRRDDCPDTTVDITRYVLNIAFYAACSGPPPVPYAAGFQLRPTSGTCEPFSLDFDFTPVTSVGTCVCCSGGGGTNLIRITE